MDDAKEKKEKNTKNNKERERERTNKKDKVMLSLFYFCFVFSLFSIVVSLLSLFLQKNEHLDPKLKYSQKRMVLSLFSLNSL